MKLNSFRAKEGADSARGRSYVRKFLCRRFILIWKVQVFSRRISFSTSSVGETGPFIPLNFNPLLLIGISSITRTAHSQKLLYVH